MKQADLDRIHKFINGTASDEERAWIEELFLNGEENPLYKMGSKRVGCFPCLASSDRNKEQNFAMDAFGQQQKELVFNLSREIGEDVYTSKGGCMRNNEKQDDLFNGCSFCAI